MDLLSNLITHIRNGQQANLKKIGFVFNTKLFQTETTHIIFSVLELLRREGYIRSYSYTPFFTQKKAQTKYTLFIYLKYDKSRRSSITAINQISIPGRRVYLSANALRQPYSTTGILCLSTSKGILTDKEARVFNVGGEVLFSIK